MCVCVHVCMRARACVSARTREGSACRSYRGGPPHEDTCGLVHGVACEPAFITPIHSHLPPEQILSGLALPPNFSPLASQSSPSRCEGALQGSIPQDDQTGEGWTAAGDR